MSELVEFLYARYDEDKDDVKVRLKALRPAPIGAVPWLNTEPVVHPNIKQAEEAYARALREIEAKRQIIDVHAGGHECASYDFASREISNGVWVMDGDDCTTVRLLALPYADHPDYREEWRPQIP